MMAPVSKVLNIIGRGLINAFNLSDTRDEGEAEILHEGKSIVLTVNKYKIHGPDKPLWQKWLNEEFFFEPIRFKFIKKARLIPGGVILSGRKVYMESAVFDKGILTKTVSPIKLLLQNLLPVSNEYQNAVCLDFLYAGNYYHWTMEALMRLALFLEYHPANKKDLIILVSFDAPVFVKDSLRYLFDLDSDQIKNLNKPVRLTNAYLPFFPFERNEKTRHFNFYDPRGIALLNRLSADKELKKESRRRVLISRPQNEPRILVDEEEVARQLNLEIVVLGELSFAQQVSLFRSAEVVVGIHGAGLTNLIYSSKDILAIELFPRNRKESDAHCFYQITRALDVAHHLVYVDQINDRQDVKLSANDLRKIEEILNQKNLNPGKSVVNKG